ncbi:MAG: type I-U CRISPR-associated RAMP protein Csb1/Cas7u [Intrasporangium sp.]|uniref:type I-G CRISPR-associated RAMP protein Csb1/Cas7g n=1 Tax=Intrasporangium sp. TaxID=1925024 RepID=UPI00264A4E54|nr:type I-U CRISPR-associated RAMP protein Csb1/Cas7u [Intrasporangium sp.]MDN5797026.1 type I-U CRISPR-associated RAMP protein Csb1/Cas7u [Intrasporangium sp.]
MTSRTIYRVPLEPVLGSRFQPTGFPDLGAATFQKPSGDAGWTQALHVESPQSMANRLELTTWDAAAADQGEGLAGLPYVRVVAEDGTFLTSSRLEAHRLASAYIMDGLINGTPGRDLLPDWLGLASGRAMDHRGLARAVFRLDPLSLVHGVFFAQKAWPWQPKIARVVTCFIDAEDVQEAVSGGVKTDSVNPKVDDNRGTAEGYGMVPHQRVEFTARTITAYVSVDHEQIRSYGLGGVGSKLLDALIDFELARLFRSGPLRLRTACDLEVRQGGESALDGIPEPDIAADQLTAAIAASSELLGPVTEVVWSQTGARKRAKA